MSSPGEAVVSGRLGVSANEEARKMQNLAQLGTSVDEFLGRSAPRPTVDRNYPLPSIMELDMPPADPLTVQLPEWVDTNKTYWFVGDDGYKYPLSYNVISKRWEIGVF
jgi:hypothetical protein